MEACEEGGSDGAEGGGGAREGAAVGGRGRGWDSHGGGACGEGCHDCGAAWMTKRMSVEAGSDVVSVSSWELCSWCWA